MAPHNQQSLDFRVAPLPRAPGSPKPLAPRISPLKRPRATTTSNNPSLPLNRRIRTAAAWKAPALKLTRSYMFKGLHPLYSRHVLEDQYSKIEIRCTQPGCDHKRIINRVLHGINNYKIYYRKNYSSIPTSKTEEKENILAQANGQRT
jgi:hypothetical protein